MASLSERKGVERGEGSLEICIRKKKFPEGGVEEGGREHEEGIRKGGSEIPSQILVGLFVWAVWVF